MENFEKYLIEKYPNLFSKNEDGSLECPCGAWVPEGWETIIDELCGAITSYTQNSFFSERKIIDKTYYFWKGCSDFLDWSHKKFIKWFPKYNTAEFNKQFFKFVGKFRNRYFKCVKYNRISPPAVKIGQIKEKFGGLRFYITGGDKQVAGMILFAEYLCSKTCEVSGEKGELCSSGGWYKTLAPKLRQEARNGNGVLIYDRYKPTKE